MQIRKERKGRSRQERKTVWVHFLKKTGLLVLSLVLLSGLAGCQKTEVQPALPACMGTNQQEAVTMAMEGTPCRPALSSLEGIAVQDIVRIPYYSSAQSEILAEALRQVLMEVGVPARTISVSGYKDIPPAMMGGTLDVAIDYTSRAWQETLDHSAVYQAGDYMRLIKAYEEMDMQWIPIPRLNGHQTLAVRMNVAEEYNLKTLSDLAGVSSELVLGTSRDFFERKEGFPLFESAYNIQFKTWEDLPESQQYLRLKEQSIDVMPVYTTDGRLLMGRLQVLKDNLDALPDFSAGVVIRDKILEKYPDLQKILYRRLRGITTQDMKEVNAMVLQNGTSVSSAAAFLLSRAAQKTAYTTGS